MNASYHLVGVAGVGMSALAQILLAQGFKVTGSDRYHDRGQELAVLDKLRRGGITLVPQDGTGIQVGTAGVVVSTAIEPDNPDIARARQLGVPIIHRAEMLAHLVRDKKTVAVTGTAGKTTVTGMIGWVLEQLGEDPTVVNGGAVLNWVNDHSIGNVRIGHGDIWMIEVDESDRSLLQFDPDWAVITNISKDHFEVSEIEKLFQAFARKVKRGIVGCFGEPTAALNEFKPQLSAQGCAFQYQGVSFNIPLLGRHNADNALQSVMLCEQLDCDLQKVSQAMSAFKGIQRRLEWIGQTRGITVIDDYAHNPAKIAAAWQAVSPYFKRVVAVWRPHGYAPLALMMGELIHALAGVAGRSNRVFILPVYYAGGTIQPTVTSEQLVEGLRQRGVSVDYVTGYDDLRRRLLVLVRPRDVVLFMGARDPILPIFARDFVLKLQHFLVNGMP